MRGQLLVGLPTEKIAALCVVETSILYHRIARVAFTDMDLVGVMISCPEARDI